MAPFHATVRRVDLPRLLDPRRTVLEVNPPGHIQLGDVLGAITSEVMASRALVPLP